jgi:hypothetical protein
VAVCIWLGTFETVVVEVLGTFEGVVEALGTLETVVEEATLVALAFFTWILEGAQNAPQWRTCLEMVENMQNYLM